MADTVRSLKITGVAAADFQRLKGGGRGKHATRRLPSMRKIQEGGDAVPGQSITSAANYAAAANISKKLNMRGGATVATNVAQVTEAVLATPKTIGQMPGTTAQMPQGNTPAKVAAIEAGTTPPVTPPATVAAPEPQKGGKVTLLPSRKKKTSRVVLAPPAAKRVTAPVTKTRKIRVQLSGLKKRMTKAKTITKDSREKPIEEIRKLLEEARLVKPAKEKKTVPESVLRDIYKDYLLLRNRAL